MRSARDAGRDQRRRLGSASTTTIRRRIAGLTAAGAIGLLLAGCGNTSGELDLASASSTTATTELVPLSAGSLEDARDQAQTESFVATATATEITAADRTGGEVDVYEQAGDDTPSQAIGNPVDGSGQAVAPVVLLVEGSYDPDADWVEVNLPVRPNGSTGWVRAEDVEVTSHEFHIEIDLDEHRLIVTDGGEEVMDVPAGVGTGQTPTPGGVFYTRSLIRSTNPAYGPYAYGLSGFSEVHETFGNGPGDIGIHGTDDESAVGTDVSNGCIRLHNEDIETLADLLPLGVPVEITE
jgi:lipoprotein-anchoring transpeptidase ErfK/SrfK